MLSQSFKLRCSVLQQSLQQLYQDHRSHVPPIIALGFCSVLSTVSYAQTNPSQNTTSSHVNTNTTTLQTAQQPTVMLPVQPDLKNQQATNTHNTTQPTSTTHTPQTTANNIFHIDLTPPSSTDATPAAPPEVTATPVVPPVDTTHIEQAQHAFQTDAVYQINPAELPEVDHAMLSEIQQIAQDAQQQAKQQATQLPTHQQIVNSEKPELGTISTQQTNTQTVQALQQDLANVQVNLPEINTELEDTASILTGGAEEPEEGNFLTRLFKRDRRGADAPLKAQPRIRIDMGGAQGQPADNIRAKLSTITQESFKDYNILLPQLRTSATQAAQAVGYFSPEIQLNKLNDTTLRVAVRPNQPVTVKSQNIIITGDGSARPVFQVIQVVPDLNVGDVLNQGLYETTKSRINNAANEQGYFDSYWRLRDLKVTLPENHAEIDLKFETGQRYKLKNVEFRMSNTAAPFPLRQSVLEQLVPFQAGDDYAGWRITNLANNLINSRYFNYSSVDAVRPDPIQRPLDLPDDIKQVIAQQNLSQAQALRQQSLSQQASSMQRSNDGRIVQNQNIINEAVFAGLDEEGRANQDIDTQGENNERERLKEQARQEKQIPVIVELNADYLNSLEAGIGYGTDTGVRLRSQYRRAIVNDRGHSFDANLELSKIRQSFSGRYMIPYNHPLNDYVNLLGGYEREVRGTGLTLDIESAVFGAERIVKRPLGEWQQTTSLRYRLDRIKGRDTVDNNLLPQAFQVIQSNPNQQSFLLGYELSKTVQNDAVNPTQGFRQFYRIEAGSKKLLTETDLALLNAGWRFVYSTGEAAKHQFVGRADLGYIFTKDFNEVPYNLRYFAGGDQSLRGYDYKSLSPDEDGILLGGQTLATGGLEYNYMFRPGWRAAVFTDVGNAYDKSFSNKTKYGVGAGIRWASPIGPIRVDVAAGVSEPKIPVRVHFFIGPPL
ncbi:MULTISPECIES: autotransporter assembly complex family protein [unclassified Acinetobacter]|uniref:autotransporter assembly complex protein TamA n=1 Tax=unclassified Acinetobacter TaxID=196816 RepID=UPI0035B93D7C